ncbi:EspG family protein [Streptoalloteichus tenebrarius]|uniref:EspG family protein n=1 Tax=Streptoalloteichus tenebrarius (strain ATCC 17920 / DSM 40477 / JCM 4838 / CBS 697.72 / NBRC 16177 / NCIMB 11028 / NRRL B-12390 / A12253. 1 / ISP 5477) TaxID=1933 RepID=A0ABT1I3G3_STRSD|nr:ESX secretion-associated protein EspG [Streptoalloteichus tenebrarius]MCP2262115.1 EspG family protein [Streptoalloteichus tenebrarius]BFF02269.1 ESX secretion-associated protein EspG [Streptoalloteichus tenebrarius]
MPIALDRAEFNVLWRRMELGARPLVLVTAEHGSTLDEAGQVDDAAWAALGARQLVGDDGTVHPDLDLALRVVSQPSVAVDLRWATGPGREVRALSAVRGETGILAVLADDVVHLDLVRDTAFVDAAVGVLPPTPPGPGTAVNVPSGAVEEATRQGGDDYDFESALLDAGVRASEARLLVDMVGGDRVAAGQFGASSWDQWGARTRAPWVISVTDTPRGRYAFYERSGWLTVAPVDHHRLVDLLRELVRSL